MTPAFFFSASPRPTSFKANLGSKRVDTYAQEPIMDVCGAAYALDAFPPSFDRLTLHIT